MLFSPRFAEAIADGSLTLTFRRWKRTQAVAGNRYRTPGGFIDVDAVDIVEAEQITDDEAHRAGYDSAAALVADLRGPQDRSLFRIRFHHVDVVDPRAELAAADDLSDDDVEEISRRLARLDKASSHGAWTGVTLDLIAAEPERRAGDLAEMLGRERDLLKVDIRKLKNLGLTLSLDVGYRLSPRGEAYRRAVRVGDAG